VARTEKFTSLTRELADRVRDRAPAGVDALLASEVEGGGSVNDQLVEAIAKLGENIQVRRIERLEAAQGGRIESYIHAGGKIGTLVQIEAGDVSSPEIEKLVRNVCMHVAATDPSGISREDIPAAEVEMERSVLRKQAETEGKPAQVVEKMVEGRLNKFFKEVVLLEQPLVMEPDLTVGKALQASAARITTICRFQLGEELTE